MTAKPSLWGPWIRHDGQGMPVPAGTIVEVLSKEDPETALDGIVRRVGTAGVDLVHSWHWTAQTRFTQHALPIDRYRIKRPRGLDILLVTMAQTPRPAESCA